MDDTKIKVDLTKFNDILKAGLNPWSPLTTGAGAGREFKAFSKVFLNKKDSPSPNADAATFLQSIHIDNPNIFTSLKKSNINTVEKLCKLSTAEFAIHGFNDFERNLVFSYRDSLLSSNSPTLALSSSSMSSSTSSTTSTGKVKLSHLTIDPITKQGILWVFKDTKWVPFSKDDNKLIEERFQKGEVQVAIKDPPSAHGHSWHANIHSLRLVLSKNNLIDISYPMKRSCRDLTNKLNQFEELCEAAFNGDEDKFFLLIKKFKAELQWMRNSRSQTLLYSACRGSASLRMIAELVKNRNLPISTAQGANDSSPLHAAIVSNKPDVVAYLLSTGTCTVNFKNSKGLSALEEGKMNALTNPLFVAYETDAQKILSFIPKTSASVKIKLHTSSSISKMKQRDKLKIRVQIRDTYANNLLATWTAVDPSGSANWDNCGDKEFFLLDEKPNIKIHIELIRECDVLAQIIKSIEVYEELKLDNVRLDLKSKSSSSLANSISGSNPGTSSSSKNVEKMFINVDLKIKCLPNDELGQLFAKRLHETGIWEETFTYFYSKVNNLLNTNTDFTHPNPANPSNPSLLSRLSNKLEKIYDSQPHLNREDIEGKLLMSNLLTSFSQLTSVEKCQHIVELEQVLPHFTEILAEYNSTIQKPTSMDMFFREVVIGAIEKFVVLLVKQGALQPTMKYSKFLFGLNRYISIYVLK